MFKWFVVTFATLTMALPAVAQNDAAALPNGAGKAVIQKMCVGCHQISVITAQRGTKEKWSMIVQQMVSRGADGSDEDIETVINYLSKNFPEKNNDATHAPIAPAPAPAAQSSLRGPTVTHTGQSQSFLAMSHTDLEAMLHASSEPSAHVQSISLSRSENRK